MFWMNINQLKQIKSNQIHEQKKCVFSIQIFQRKPYCILHIDDVWFWDDFYQRASSNLSLWKMILNKNRNYRVFHCYESCLHDIPSDFCFQKMHCIQGKHIFSRAFYSDVLYSHDNSILILLCVNHRMQINIPM